MNKFITFLKESEYRFVLLNIVFWTSVQFLYFPGNILKQLFELLLILPFTSVLCWFLTIVFDRIDFY